MGGCRPGYRQKAWNKITINVPFIIFRTWSDLIVIPALEQDYATGKSEKHKGQHS